MDTLTTSHNFSDAAESAGSAAIALNQVHLTLEGPVGPVNILRGVNLNVSAGTALGVVGPSGSGKTTMLMIIAGLERISAGRVEVAGTDYAALNEDALALFRRDAVGIVFQSFHLIPTMSALENVAVPLEFAGLKDAFDRAEDQLKSVGLGHRIDHYPGQLSGGEQQRVALARAFAVKPKILLADEPTGNLDSATGQQVIDLLFELHDKSNTTLMLITHDFNLAKRCDRVVRIADGLIVGEGLADLHEAKRG
ncbi:MAG TPA: ABC transporter [Rhodospirillaceae bacterium]|nr:ABC transporter [Candidatus Neomarinimicrobiota bacterium]HCX15211.1 ABC transporter [Rhodospirillaceae bacterium]|tara:strand:+ start:263 stop:1018 length:756 start_codon:yes stop_codon:yes gene_type:complete